MHDDPRLTSAHRQLLTENEESGLGVSVISCWEVAKLVEYGRMLLPCPTSEWIEQALTYPGVQLISFTPQIALESTELPGEFHRDPADQIIVATARLLARPLVTADEKILQYPHVEVLTGRV